MVDLRKLCVTAAAALLLFGGCKSDDKDADHDDDHDDSTLGPLSGATCPTDHADLTYEKFGQTFMTTYCTRCHSSTLKTLAARMNATLDHDFDVYDSIKGMHSHIDRKAASGPSATNTSMPPTDPKPSMAERQKLGQWLACEF